MTTIQRLTKCLNEKDSQIEELESKLQEFEDAECREWKWAIHKQQEKDNSGLPVPRLELRAITINGDWANFVWQYSLVFTHLLRHIVIVPIGQTTCNGSRSEPPVWPISSERPYRIQTPFRDGAHIINDAEELGLPAWAIVETDSEHITEDLLAVHAALRSKQ